MCVCGSECVDVRAALDLSFPVKVCDPVCQRASVHQWECLFCHSKGQLIIWGAASLVVVIAAHCHEERRGSRGRQGFVRPKSLADHRDHCARKYPINSTKGADELESELSVPPAYEQILNYRSKIFINIKSRTHDVLGHLFSNAQMCRGPTMTHCCDSFHAMCNQHT